ncbi:MAG: hypothetical protein JXM70_00370 [Pirellulales bacterium]|nr:hypothetical protein [Pirellulales bacterium]
MVAKKPLVRKPSTEFVKIDPVALQKAGIRRIAGKHLTLFTDLPQSPAVDELPAVFDQAFGQWCEYFGINPAEHDAWHINGFLIKNKEPFERLRLMPLGNLPFKHGYSQSNRLWLYDQKSDYYRRHLLLHEGTHCFMDTFLGGCGPPWYMEGMAELLGTHSWKDGKLELNYFPAAKEEAPLWNRPKIVSNAVAAGRLRCFEQVLGYGPTDHQVNEPYGWCWTAAVLLDRHPRYHERFRALFKKITDADFNQRFKQLIGDDWEDLQAQWLAFVADLEFGHDVGRTDIQLSPSEPLPPEGKTVRIQADRGWQNSGIQLKAGRKYRLRGKGRYQVADKPKIWWCEPGGVTIRYYRGRPLGILLGALYPNQPDKNTNPFEKPFAIGLETTFTPRVDGMLFLKINDSSAELHDNAGQLHVRIEPAGNGGG